MPTATSLSLASFTKRLEEIGRALRARDPEGADFALRVSIAHALFLAHDRLRSEERPFDREAFALRLDDAARAIEKAERVRPEPDASTRERPPYEEYVADLYSRCWARYSDREFEATVDFFQERFRLNGARLDALAGADALDAGCGSGRYTIAMVRAGAQRAIGVDLSERALREARERAGRLGCGSRVTFERRSVIDLPRAWSDRFDFVCSNGVVHHTPDPIRGVQEIFRVLKPGGSMFIMVYGKGGLFWPLTDFIREILAPVPLDFAEAWLQLAGTPVGKIFFCLDHWYTQYQERVDQDEFERRLRDAGFVDLRYLPRALVYDSSERLERYPEEADLIGSPDLRYLARKP